MFKMPSPTFFLPLPKGGGGLKWGRIKVGEGNFLPDGVKVEEICFSLLMAFLE